ncbi:MAG: MmcQ/YjbR family DNA-binding protein [Sediminibacterium sp.]
MTLGNLIDYALTKPATEETLPFGPDVLVLKTNGKSFLLVSLNSDPVQFNAKCDPEKALQLREMYEGIVPGYHMNKKHWNTVILDGSVPDKLVRELIDHSYELVSAKKKK